MPNVPNQFPNIDLPGAEYFSLAPNASIAIQGRRRFRGGSNLTSVPANSSTTFQYNPTIETGFTDSSGIYVHHIVVSLGALGFGLMVTGLIVGFNTLPSFPDIYYVVGYPFLSPVVPSIGQPVFSDRDFLVTARDVSVFNGGNNGNLVLGLMMGITNTQSTAVQGVAGIQIVYTRLDGFTE